MRGTVNEALTEQGVSGQASGAREPRPGVTGSQWPGALWGALAVVVPLAVLLVHAARYFPFIADDALISLRYSERFTQGLGLTWTDGERVEGYSNLLWVLLNAGLKVLGVDLIHAARLLGVGCFAVVFFCLYLASDDRRRPFGASLFVSVLLALTGPIAVWSIGGLEQPLCAALLAIALMLCTRFIQAGAPGRLTHEFGAALALLCWTRPDAPLLVAALALTSMALRRRVGSLKALLQGLQLLAWPVAAVAVQLMFRLWYYGDVLPNTAYVKGEVSWERAREGLDYISSGAKALTPLLFLAAAGLYSSYRSPSRRARTLPALAVLVSWSAYLVAIGGDIFPAHRHFVVTLVALGWLCLEGTQWLFGRHALWSRFLVAGIAGVVLTLQLDQPANRTAIVERWEWEGQVIGELFRDGFHDQRPYLAVTAAGTLPYFSRLPALDMQGLNDRHIARRPSEAGFLGHDHGDGPYVLGRAPDIIAFRGPGRGPPAFVSGRQMRHDPRFRNNYKLVRFEGHDPFYAVSLSWLRRQGKVGMKRTENRLVVPAYLLDGAVGQLGDDSAMVGYIAEKTSATSPVLTLGEGVWSVRLEPPNRLLQIEVINQDRQPLETRGARFGASFRMHVRLRLQSGAIATSVCRLVVERAGPMPSGHALKQGKRRVLKRRAKLKPGRVLRALHEEASSWPDRQGYVGQTEAGLGTFHPELGDKSRAELETGPIVVPPEAMLELSLAGGADRSQVGVRLKMHGRTLMTWAGADSDEPRLHRFDLSRYAGRSIVLEVFDDSEGHWGHTDVRGLWLKQLAPTTKGASP